RFRLRGHLARLDPFEYGQPLFAAGTAGKVGGEPVQAEVALGLLARVTFQAMACEKRTDLVVIASGVGKRVLVARGGGRQEQGSREGQVRGFHGLPVRLVGGQAGPCSRGWVTSRGKAVGAETTYHYGLLRRPLPHPPSGFVGPRGRRLWRACAGEEF